MKKNGFTLSELIVSLSIIGIASALMMPALTNLVPDKHKVKVINVHSKIVDTVSTLINDDSVYGCETNNNPALQEGGLTCDGQPNNAVYNNPRYSGTDKFENLMIHKLGLEQPLRGDQDFNLASVDGILWRFERGCEDNNGVFTQNAAACPTLNTLAYRISVDLIPGGRQGVRNANSIYTPNSQKPDRFRFRVNNYGGVLPDDAMTAAYLKNAFKYTSKKEDRDEARILYNTKARYRAQ